MKVGVVREIKPDEGRVALTPAGAAALVKAGHQVYVEKGAGEGSSLKDEAYQAAGAVLLSSAAEVWATSDLILKVKEPLAQEYAYMRDGQILFTYLHLAADPTLTRELINRKVVAIAYETVQLSNGSLPLLSPMSEVAGRMSVQIGAHFLEKPSGGRGVLLGGVTGVPRGEVVILGGGTVGTNAAKVAVGLGANVTVFDISRSRLQYLDDIFQGRVQTRISNPYDIAEALTRADLVIDAVLVPGARTPTLVTRDMVRAMQPGSVIVDVAVDQGGSVETIDRVTTHRDPTYVVDGVVHYAVPNIPGAVPRTSTFALTGVTLPYALEIANKGWRRALKENAALARGANVIEGKVTYRAVAEANGLPYTPLETLLG